VAIEPIHAAVGVEVRLIENAPDTGATHGPGSPVLQGGHQVIKPPARGRAMISGRLTGRYRPHIETL
jgi:hypothetical protein